VLLVDANVLVYAVNKDAAHHGPCRAWLDRALSSAEPVGLSWVSLLAFLRVTTHPAVLEHPFTVAEATDQVRTWLGAPAALIVDPTPRHVDVLAGLLAETGTAGNLVSDAHLAALATEHRATIVSLDRDFGRFAGVRWRAPSAAAGG
jgi:toxin-antitoxin system PIN domain toxin